MARWVLCLIWFLGAIPLSAQLRMVVRQVPGYTPVGDTIFLAGSFNRWQPGDPGYALKREANGEWAIDLLLEKGDIEFKFTRGAWSKVEKGQEAGSMPNRKYPFRGGKDTVHYSIESWEDMSDNKNTNPSSRVQIIARDFAMPQLGRTRRIWIYLPEAYQKDPQRHFPVLYLQDGQNIFDAATSFAGEWYVDESMDQLQEAGVPGAIIVAIDNGGELRMNEYSPWAHPRFGEGEGAEYVQFIIETLKPFIDQHYRTLPGPEHTGIMGSSMGGLIALYAIVEYQDFFGKAGIFSPSLWYSKEAFRHIQTKGNQKNPKLFLAAGQLEGPHVIRDLNKLHQTLIKSGFPAAFIKKVIHEDGKHQEWYWAREFPTAYEWLFVGEKQ
ncbi:MAG: alpha/beta hydrolase [Haliscomenobacter sp.]|nr:alpha/beta hydrolase [Haliscomenobacter sp.]MBK7474594.1 alpha/beta hydrolase [Haliscomenobacter sp.]MBK8877758.1 alpha/beta hydrolase [Haliscomenobacter sp.]